MNASIYFITGVCGVGKSAIIPRLRLRLPKDRFDVHDFDERGVPTNASRAWRISETQYWIEQGMMNVKKGISTIICGFANPEERPQLVVEEGVSVNYILLDADEATVQARLSGRYQDRERINEIQRVSGGSVESFIHQNVTFLPTLRAICRHAGCVVVDTNRQTIEMVADEVVHRLLNDDGSGVSTNIV